MNADLTICVQVSGMEESATAVQSVRNALAERQPMHSQMAMDVRDLTRSYLLADDSHASAHALGAKPTGFRAKFGGEQGGIEAEGSADQAVMRIPRNSGLGRAFRDFNIEWNGVKRLTIPACAATYGKSARDFPDGILKFGVVQGRFPALVWASDPTQPAYWLVKKVHQSQDRSLLPSDADLRSTAQRSAYNFLRDLASPSTPPTAALTA